MQNNHPKSVENYTNAFLGVTALILFMALWVVGTLGGFLWIALTTATIDLGIKRLANRRARSRDNPSRPF